MRLTRLSTIFFRPLFLRWNYIHRWCFQNFWGFFKRQCYFFKSFFFWRGKRGVSFQTERFLVFINKYNDFTGRFFFRIKNKNCERGKRFFFWFCRCFKHIWVILYSEFWPRVKKKKMELGTSRFIRSILSFKTLRKLRISDKCSILLN